MDKIIKFPKKILITMDREEFELFKSVKGMSQKDAVRAKQMIIGYLSEKSYIKAHTVAGMNIQPMTAGETPSKYNPLKKDESGNPIPPAGTEPLTNTGHPKDKDRKDNFAAGCEPNI